MHFKNLIFFLIALTFLGCKKKKIDEPIVPNQLSNGILVLNEGLFQQNNSTLGWINMNDFSYSGDFFEQKNGRSLGDTGNDLQRYGGKIYVIVNVSSTLEILDATTGKSIKQIAMVNNGVNKQPRHIVFNGSKGFITCYDGFIDVLDTVSLTITQRIQVGSNPEDLTVCNGNLYVTNSGGLNAPNVDSTVSVINLNTLQEIKRITVGKNPGGIEADNFGDVYVISRGDYNTIPSRMHRIDCNTNTVVESFSFDASGISLFGNQFLIKNYNYSTNQSSIALFDTQSESLVSSNFINTSNIQTLYGVKYHAGTNKIYCFDAKNYTVTGNLLIYSSNGTYERTIPVGLNPSKIIIYE